MPEVYLKNFTVQLKVKRKQYVTAVDNVDAHFANGKVNVLIGPSGCGKTSILRGVIGLVPHEGDILFDNINVNEYRIDEKGLSYVSQSLGLYPHLSIFNNIAFPLKVAGSDPEEIRRRVDEVSELLKIKHCLTRKPRQLSMGQAQRVAIARALIKKPILYLFDEPFSNLDKPLAEELIIELKKIFIQNNATVIYVTHDMKEALTIGDEIFVMENGKIVEQVAAKDITKSKNPLVKEYLKTL